MDNIEYKIGDKIYHASNPSILWIIERIEGNDVFCSTVLSNTFEQKKETFTKTSIVKYEKREMKSSNISKRRNMW